MGGFSEHDLNLDIAKYYATRGKLAHLDEVFREYSGRTALSKACAKGYLEIVKCLLAAGAGKNKADDYGITPLIDAARGGHVEIVQLLLSAGADKDKANRYGLTPLRWAAGKGHSGENKRKTFLEIVRLLLSAGADKDKADNDGWTALSHDTSEGHQEIVQLLQ